MLELGAGYNKKIKTSEAVQIAVEGIEQLEIFFSGYLPQLIYSLLAPITLFTVLAFLNLKAALVLLICVPIIPVSIMAIQKFAKKLLSKYWSTYTDMGDSFLENIQGLTTLKIYERDAEKSDKIFNLLDLKVDNQNREDLIKPIKSLSFNNVTFNYEDDHEVLQNINFDLKQNNVFGFVGESGSGKSTITSLALGLYNNYQGSIKINKQEITNISEKSIMENITLLNNNAYLFKGSVKII